jgi:metal-responsive CopG/Arc/MetJ family transcriptional regulator
LSVTFGGTLSVTLSGALDGVSKEFKMRRIEGKRFTIILSSDLAERTEKQMKKEGRSQSEFIRRVLDRYLVEQEFRGDYESAEAATAAEESIKANRQLLEKLRNS